MKKTLYLLILTFALTVCSSFAAVTNVSSGGAIYLTLSNAVFAAGAGDMLLVSTGTYYETVDIYNKHLVIDGKYRDDFTSKVADGRTIISAPIVGLWYSGSTFDITNSTVTFINIEITKGGFWDGDSANGGGIDARYRCNIILYGCSVYTNFCLGNGGGIYLNDSNFYATNTHIFGNNAYSGSFFFGDNGCGGGIYADRSTLNLCFDTDLFNNKASSKGGGIRLYISDADVRDSNIDNNNAKEGGGVSAYASMYSQHEKSALYANLAATKGGGIVFENNSIGIITGIGAYIGFGALWGPNVVTNGDGGGIYVSDSILAISNNAYVTHNIATVRGGGIFLTNGTLLVKDAGIGVQHPLFTNSAIYGGGLYAMSSTINITNSTVAHGFAAVGGGLVMIDCSTAIDDSDIVENWALDSSGTKMGGGILFGGSNNFNASKSSFNNNEAGFGGGVALFTEIGNVNFDNCSIISNTAESGGGFFVYFGSSVNISGYSDISYNTALYSGGGILAAYGYVNLNGDSLAPISIMKNTAGTVGGGIYGALSYVEGQGNIWIGYNEADYGGGIYLTNNVNMVLTNSVSLAPRVFGNTAYNSGGGIFIIGSDSAAKLYNVSIGAENIGNICHTISGTYNGGGGIAVHESARVDAVNCIFQDNYSSNSGGAIYLGTNTIFNMICDHQSKNSYIYNNTAKNAGGGIYAMLADEILLKSIFVVSNKTQVGGAGGLYIGKTANKLINLVVAQNDCGYVSGADGIFFYDCPKSEMLQCTIADNDRYGVMNNLAGTVYMTNCIVYGHSVDQLKANSPINAVYSDIQNSYPGVGNIDAAPLFADPSAFKYDIVLGSPCENAGTDLLSVTNDIAGTFRPQDVAWDMGAYEVIPEPGFYLLFIIGNLIFLFRKIKFRI